MLPMMYLSASPKGKAISVITTNATKVTGTLGFLITLGRSEMMAMVPRPSSNASSEKPSDTISGKSNIISTTNTGDFMPNSG